MTRIKCKWRPPLWLVVAVTLLVVLCLPVIGIVFVRYAAPVMGYREAVYGVGCGVLAATFVMGWGLWRFLLSPVRALRDRVGVLRSGGEDAFALSINMARRTCMRWGNRFLIWATRCTAARSCCAALQTTSPMN
ncbi:hypothetical protein OAE29_03545 [Octadecabacter sp.]|nr:hypothetical protein [Octadecabacter sp.]